MISAGCILLLTLFALLLYYIVYRFRYFSARSIPSPPIRSIFFGHMLELWSVSLYSHQIRDWTCKYGSVYGLFEGMRPIYVISDIKMIEEIFVKQFTRFSSRRTTLTMRIVGRERWNVFTSNDINQWKRQRMVLNPTFSAAKLKKLLPIIENCIDLFFNRLKSIEDQANINIYTVYKRLTMDVICRCAFGIDTKIQEDADSKNNIYFTKIEELFAKDFERTNLGRMYRIFANTPFAKVFPFLFRVKSYFLDANSDLPANLWLMKNMGQFIEQRIEQNSTNVPNDLLQLMIDAFHSQKVRIFANWFLCNDLQGDFSSTELLSNVFITLIAGFETTSTALAYCTHYLFTHPELQEKLYQEIKESKLTQFNIYDCLNNKLPYLDAFIRETLRLNPIVVQAVHRECAEDTIVGNYLIRKGCLIQADVLSIHFDDELWGPEPVEEFIPERHMRKRNQLAFMPFGAGPRLCIGMRFALLEMKLALVRLIDQYKIYSASDEPQPLKLREELVITPENVNIRLVKREPSLNY